MSKILWCNNYLIQKMTSITLFYLSNYPFESIFSKILLINFNHMQGFRPSLDHVRSIYSYSVHLLQRSLPKVTIHKKWSKGKYLVTILWFRSNSLEFLPLKWMQCLGSGSYRLGSCRPVIFVHGQNDESTISF